MNKGKLTWVGASDPLTMIVKSHLYIEALLTDAVLAKVRNPEDLEIDSFSFAQKLRIAAGLGVVPDGMLEPIKYVNKVRNGFSHDVNFAISKETVDTLLSRFSGKSRKLLNEKHKRIHAEDNPFFQAERHRATLIACLTEIVGSFKLFRRTIKADKRWGREGRFVIIADKNRRVRKGEKIDV